MSSGWQVPRFQTEVGEAWFRKAEGSSSLWLHFKEGACAQLRVLCPTCDEVHKWLAARQRGQQGSWLLAWPGSGRERKFCPAR